MTAVVMINRPAGARLLRWLNVMTIVVALIWSAYICYRYYSIDPFRRNVTFVAIAVVAWCPVPGAWAIIWGRWTVGKSSL